MRIAVLTLMLVSLTFLLTCASQAAELLAVQAGSLRISLSDTGRMTSFWLDIGEREILPAGQVPALLTLTVDEQALLPSAASWDETTETIQLDYPGGAKAAIKIQQKATHATFTLERLEGPAVSRAEWGPFPTTLGDSVGELVCVARDETAAIGLQGLTLQINAAASTADYGEACPHGSRLVSWAREHEGGVLGAAIAVFGCKAEDALATIGEIEIAEGLPHPTVDGVWGKVSPAANEAYLICPYGVGTIEETVALTRKLGFRDLYHPGPFETWGHFILGKHEFPEGDASLKLCSEIAAESGVRLGVHTLTAFITPNDPYVSPKPDPRLARLGSSRLAADVDVTATELPVEDWRPFVVKQYWGWDQKFVVLGEEIISYTGVTEEAPYRLTGCARGQFDTTTSAHLTGDDLGALATHNYHTFYPGIEGGMIEEMTDRLVQLVNDCNLHMLSFDGLEGLLDYGWEGDYTRNLFVSRCFAGFDHEVTSDASNLLHYLWHIHTRMNWGEPWGKALREGMPEYRLNNQAFFERNLFPKMMGWFLFQPAVPGVEATRLDDIEWMLSKAAGFDAGFALVSTPGDFKTNMQGDAVAKAIAEWEKARNSGAFTQEQRARLRDGRSDWHLEAAGEGYWKLFPMLFPPALACGAASPMVEGQVENPYEAQPLQFVIRILPSDNPEAALENPILEIGNQKLILPVRVTPDRYIRGDGKGNAEVCDSNWHVLDTVRIAGGWPLVASGTNTVRLSCELTGGAQVTFRLQLAGPAEAVVAPD